MSVPDENITKCTLLVQRSPKALIHYHTMFFPPHLIHQTKHARGKADMTLKVQRITKHFFMKGKQNIPSLHRIICNVVSLFLLYVKTLVAACKVSSVFNHIRLNFL